MSPFRYTRRAGLVWLALVLGTWGTLVHALDTPKGKVVLTVSGRIGAHNQAGQAAFDMAMLEAMPQKVFSTLTPWDKAEVTFSGPLLRDVLAAVRAQGQQIRATAINDYRIRIPVADSQRFDVIVATRMNGAPMPVRDKGPLFIVYPFDSRAELRSATYFERSIWQLRSLELE